MKQNPKRQSTHPRRSHKLELRPGQVVDLFQIFSWLLIGLLVVFSIQNLQLVQSVANRTIAVWVVVALLINLIIYRRHELLAIRILETILFLATGLAYLTGGIEAAGRLWLLPFPFITFFLLGYRRGRMWVVLMVAWVAIVNAAAGAGWIHLPYPPELNFSFLVLYSFMTVMAILIGLQVNRQVSQLYSETQHERQLEQEMRKFKMAVDNVAQPVVMTDPDGKIIYANPSIEWVSGWSVQDILGQSARTSALWGGGMTSEENQAMWKKLQIEKQSFVGKIKSHKRNGEPLVARFLASPVFDHHHQVMFHVAVFEDITQEQAVEGAKAEFLSIASHQLQTPISAIGWLSELLLDGVSGKLTDQQRAVVKKIDQSNQRMVELVNELLNTSRIDVGTFMISPEQTDVASILRDVVRTAQTRPIHNIVITEEYDRRVPSFSADPVLLRLVVENLVTNAIRYTPEGGHVTVRLKADPDGLTIEVADTGIGIPAGSRRHIFTKFYRAPNAAQRIPEGLGLGMYMTKAVVEASGGTINFSSTEGQGTTFQVRFPKSGMQSKSGSRHLTLLSSQTPS